jgi:hypothetical protein
MTCADSKRPEMHLTDLPAEQIISLIILKQNADALAVMNPPD